jgi:hypothetical protein
MIATALHLENSLRWYVIRISFLNVKTVHWDLPEFLNNDVVALLVNREA